MIRHNGIEIDRVERTISHNGKSCRFKVLRDARRSVIFDLVCALILGPGYTWKELVAIVYGDDPNGGPSYSPVIGLQALLYNVKKDLPCVKDRLDGIDLVLVKKRHVGNQLSYSLKPKRLPR